MDTIYDDLLPSGAQIQGQQEGDVKYPYADKCPVVLLLDTSGSMSGKPIRELNEGLKVLLRELLNDPEAKQRVEVAVVTFGGSVKVIQNFKLPEDTKIPELQAGGSTPMGEAIEKGIELLAKRKKYLRQQGVNYYRPWLVLITDGYPTDMKKGDRTYNKVRNDLLQQVNGKHIIAWFFGTETADFNTLKDLHPQGLVFKLKEHRFKEIFKWLSASMSAVSKSTPGQKAGVPNPAKFSQDIISVEI